MWNIHAKNKWSKIFLWNILSCSFLFRLKIPSRCCFSIVLRMKSISDKIRASKGKKKGKPDTLYFFYKNESEQVGKSLPYSLRSFRLYIRVIFFVFYRRRGVMLVGKQRTGVIRVLVHPSCNSTSFCATPPFSLSCSQYRAHLSCLLSPQGCE
jgi:hypothetical protein